MPPIEAVVYGPVLSGLIAAITALWLRDMKREDAHMKTQELRVQEARADAEKMHATAAQMAKSTEAMERVARELS